jgi:hypothetical protein
LLASGGQLFLLSLGAMYAVDTTGVDCTEGAGAETEVEEDFLLLSDLSYFFPLSKPPPGAPCLASTD